MAQAATTPVGRILVATDFSETSDAACREATRYAEHFGAGLHLLHVVWPGTDPIVPPALTKLAQELRRTVRVETAVAAGRPAHEIVRYADRHGIDLIVIGTHGRTGVSRALLGSVAEQVVRTARCPVLTVPRAERGEVPAETADAAARAARCVVCGTPAGELICETCRTRIRGEALEHKRREERMGRV